MSVDQESTANVLSLNPPWISDVNSTMITYAKAQIRSHWSLAIGAFLLSVGLLFLGQASWFIVFAAGYVWVSRIFKAVHNQFFSQFASANGFDYEKSGKPRDLSGALFHLSDARSTSFSNLVSGRLDARPFDLFVYHYEVGYGKNAQRVTYTVISLHLSANMPHIIISPEEGIGPFSDEFTFEAEGMKHISLEGDFDKYYGLYAEENTQIDVLEIVTPDFMEMLVALPERFSIELVGNTIYVYFPWEVGTARILLNMAGFARALAAKIEPVADRMRENEIITEPAT